MHVRRADTGETQTFTCAFLFCCGGYYRYDAGYTPDFAGLERFPGPVVHPQHWPEDLDYAGKRVVVIGSGATAVTLVPALARDGRARDHAPALAHLHRLAALPRRRGRLAAPAAAQDGRLPLVRVKNVALMTLSYQLSRRRPNLMKSIIRRGAQRQLPDGYDVDTHFRPDYNPWDQRLCVVPDGDLFAAVSAGRASIVTDRGADVHRARRRACAAARSSRRT